MIRSRPVANKNRAHSRTEWSLAAKRLRRLGLITLVIAVVVATPLALAGQLPGYLLVIAVGPAILCGLSFLPFNRVAPK